MPCLSLGSSFCGVPLFWYSTVVPWCFGYSVGVPHSVVPCSVVPTLFRRSAGVPCYVVPCSSVPGFTVCLLQPLEILDSKFTSEEWQALRSRETKYIDIEYCKRKFLFTKRMNNDIFSCKYEFFFNCIAT